MGSSPKAPPPRSYQGEMFEALRAQAAIMPELMALERRYVPEMQKLQMEGYRGQMIGLNQMFKDFNPEMGQRALEYTRSIQPAMTAAATQSKESYMAGMGSDAKRVLSAMGRQAVDEVERGGVLGDKERMFAEDAARRAGSARGVIGGNQGLAMELLTSHQMEQNRIDRGRKFATDYFNLEKGVTDTGLSTYGSTYMGGINSLSPMNMLGLSRQGQTELGPSFFKPENNYNSNLIGANQNMQFQAAAAKAAGQNQLMGAGIGAIGMMACWVARCVYGEDNIKWMVFREWLLTDAPSWFRELYLSKGERFADFIKDKPFIKSIVKKAMDIVVERELSKQEKVIFINL